MSGGNLRGVYHFYTMAVTAANGVTLTFANGCNPTTSFRLPVTIFTAMTNNCQQDAKAP